jgi:hypothetical protein
METSHLLVQPVSKQRVRRRTSALGLTCQSVASAEISLSNQSQAFLSALQAQTGHFKRLVNLLELEGASFSGPIQMEADKVSFVLKETQSSTQSEGLSRHSVAVETFILLEDWITDLQQCRALRWIAMAYQTVGPSAILRVSIMELKLGLVQPPVPSPANLQPVAAT